VSKGFERRDDDPVTRRLVELSRAGALGERVLAEQLPPAYRRCWGKRLLSRPLALPARDVAAAADDVLTVFDVLARLPELAYGGDLLRFGDALGIDRRRVELLRRFPLPGRTRYGRADLYHDGDRLRLLEFNVASDLGGVDRCVLQQSLLAIPAFRELADEVGLSYVHTGEVLADDLRAAAGPGAGGREPAVALVCAPGGLARFGHLVDAFVEMMSGVGLDVATGEGDELRAGRGRVTLRGRRVDVVLRFFTIDDVVDDPVASTWAEPLLRAAVDGDVVLWTPLDSTLLSNKGALAQLSTDGVQAALTDDERAALARVLPPSWLLTGTRGPLGGDLLDDCVALREQLVLKPLRDFGGSSVVPGWERAPDEWERALRDGLGRGWLVQQRVVPRVEPVVDALTGVEEDWVAAWGMFVTPSGYAGTDVRAAPLASSGVVNYGSNPATRVTGVFAHA
jgi:hypothetical protein